MSDLAIREMNSAAEEKQYVICNINKEYYGIDITHVNNIIQMPKITMVPKAPECFKGIINLRGEIVPIMSLRRRMNLEDDTLTKDSRIVILNINDDEMIGVVVDGVKEVLSIPTDTIETPADLLKSEDSLIRGIGKKNEDLISIFEIDSILKNIA
ncbi:MAG: purine-binding chemotaxis protein CheW [Pseudobutyrivibrio sp.]|nr:purine-binding chemotaxis protein CheW [Pseudobutyrivibrio sp.]